MFARSSVNNNPAVDLKETLSKSKSKISSQFHQEDRDTTIIPPTAVQMLQRVTQKRPCCSFRRRRKRGPILMHICFCWGFLGPCPARVSVCDIRPFWTTRSGRAMRTRGAVWRCVCMNTGIPADETRTGVSILSLLSGELSFLNDKKYKRSKLTNTHSF